MSRMYKQETKNIKQKIRKGIETTKTLMKKSTPMSDEIIPARCETRTNSHNTSPKKDGNIAQHEVAKKKASY